MNFKKFANAINYIYWKKEALQIKCTFSEFNEVLDRLEKNGKKIEYTTKREYYNNLVYSVVVSKYSNNKCIYLYENKKYYIYYTNKIDDNKNKRDKAYGYEGLTIVKQKFEVENGTSFKKAFGYVEEEFKRCVPKIFSYSNSKYYGKILMTSSVDFSSHWPFNVQGRLPDYHGYVKFEGTVEPNEEYPFAFYLNSGHVAEYGVFDSHNWTKSSLMDAMFRYGKGNIFPQKPFLNPNEDITILMKASKYELGKYYKEFYDMRETDEDAKLYANASLGFMHKKKYDRFKMAHIVAIVLGRAQSKTIEAMNEIGEMNILHAVVDGFIYKGNLKLGEDEKYFGNLHQEWTNCATKIVATNCYIVMENNKCIKVKHGSYECRKDGTEIKKENVKDFFDFTNWTVKRGVE